jgi:hypothetical protein
MIMKLNYGLYKRGGDWKRFLIEVVHYIKLRKVIYSTDVDIL